MGRLVLAGAGHGHLLAIQRLGSFLDRGHKVVVIGPGPVHSYSGLGPALLSGEAWPEQARFPVARMVRERGGTFIEDKVAAVSPERRLLLLASGREIPYDIVSFNVGSEVAPLPSDGSVPRLPAKPIDNLLDARLQLERLAALGSPRVLVVGGGAAGVELAGGAWRLLKQRCRVEPRITLAAGERLLARFPKRARRLALFSLLSRDIEVIEDAHALALGDGKLLLDDGQGFPADLVLLATGTKAPRVFEGSGLATGPDGGLLVNDRLQAVQDPRVFGAGDCVSLEGRKLERVGVHAVRQAPVLARNLLAALEGEPLERFVPQNKHMLILNLGDGSGLFIRDGLVLRGRFWRWLKQRIDLRFMRRFGGGEG